MGGVAGDEQLELLVQVTAVQVHVPGSDSYRRENNSELILIRVQNGINSPQISQITFVL